MASKTLSRASLVYTRIVHHRFLATLVLLVITPLLFIADISTGAVDLPLDSVVKALLGLEGGEASLIVWSVRLPVALAAVLAGASLALAGLLMQTVLDNPLASPYTLGVASAAAFGAALAYVTGLAAIPVLHEYAVTCNAFVFAVASIALVYTLGRVRGFTSEALVLAGIAVNYIFHSLLALMEYIASEEALQAIVFWLFGSLYKATWEKLTLMTLVLVSATPVVLHHAWRLSALRLGDDAAAAMGVNPRRERLIAFLTASVLTATTVSIHGVIAFVGLVAPHIARLLVGEDHRFLAPASAFTGASLLLASDIVGKCVTRGAILPIGIVTSLIGVPVLIALLISRRAAKYW